MKITSMGKKQIQFLVSLLTLATIVLAGLGYVRLFDWTPADPNFASLKGLALGVLPSVIAAMSALVVVYVLFTVRDIRVAFGDNPSLTDFAAELVEHMKELHGQLECEKAENNICGWWEMRDWRDNYPCEVPATEVSKRISIAKGKSLSIDARLLQSGSLVTGSFSNKQDDGEDAKYALRGRVKGNVLIADWVEVTPKKNFPWFGSVQCVISQGSFEKTMLGRWVGISHDERVVHSGVWEWRQRREADEKSKRKWPTEKLGTHEV